MRAPSPAGDRMLRSRTHFLPIMLLREVDESMHQTLVDPIGRDAAERAAIAVKLAAFDGEPLLSAAGKSKHPLNLRTSCQ